MERYFEINERGHNIRCKIYCRDVHTVTSVVIFGHGFGGHKDNNAAARFAEKLTAKHKKSALITFDWPCHGDDVKKKLYLEDCGTYLELVVEYAHGLQHARLPCPSPTLGACSDSQPLTW